MEMEDDRESRMKALRERVQAKKNAGTLIEPEEPLVITNDEYQEVVTVEEPQQDDWFEMLDRDADRWRNLAASLVLIDHGIMTSTIEGRTSIVSGVEPRFSPSMLIAVGCSVVISRRLKR